MAQLILIAFPTIGNLTKKLDPGVEKFGFLQGEKEPNHSITSAWIMFDLILPVLETLWWLSEKVECLTYRYAFGPPFHIDKCTMTIQQITI